MLNCNLLNAYALNNKLKTYGINCNFREKYLEEITDKANVFNEDYLTALNSANVNYVLPCKSKRCISYYNTSTYTCVNGFITSAPNQLTLSFKNNNLLSYQFINTVSIGALDSPVDVFTASMRFKIDWTNTFVPVTNINILNVTTSILTNEISLATYTTGKQSLVSVYEGLISGEHIFRADFIWHEYEVAKLPNSTYHITYNITASDTVNTVNKSYKITFGLLGTTITGLSILEL